MPPGANARAGADRALTSRPPLAHSAYVVSNELASSETATAGTDVRPHTVQGFGGLGKLYIGDDETAEAVGRRLISSIDRNKALLKKRYTNKSVRARAAGGNEGGGRAAAT